MRASLVNSETVTGQEVIKSATEPANDTANESHLATGSVAEFAGSVF